MSFRGHLTSFVTETCVAGMAATVMYGLAVATGTAIGLDREALSILMALYVIPFAVMIVVIKAMFPRTVKYRSWPAYSYIMLAQWEVASLTAALLDFMGEKPFSSGNIHDVAFYGILAGTVYGFIYAIFSKIGSKDVDSFTPTF